MFRRDTEVTTIDPVTLAVIQNGLQQVCNEMDTTFVRAAFSPVIAEGLDRSDGIYHRSTGELIAQGELGLPIFVGTMQFSTRAVIDRAKNLEEGDIFILNDPYLGGTGRIPAAWCPEVFQLRQPKSNKKDFEFLR